MQAGNRIENLRSDEQNTKAEANIPRLQMVTAVKIQKIQRLLVQQRPLNFEVVLPLS